MNFLTTANTKEAGIHSRIRRRRWVKCSWFKGCCRSCKGKISG